MPLLEYDAAQYARTFGQQQAYSAQSEVIATLIDLFRKRPELLFTMLSKPIPRQWGIVYSVLEKVRHDGSALLTFKNVMPLADQETT